MKAKNKRGDSGKPSHNIRLIAVTVGVTTAILILASVIIYIFPIWPSEPKAAIVDQLGSSFELTESSRHANQTFIDAAMTLLNKRFSRIDYYSDNATVENYKSLSSRGYKLIIWRAHSALDIDSKFVAIATSEMNIQGKYDQYSNNQLTLCNIPGDPRLYFAITPDFVKECMNGRFEDTVIIFMSCNGLKTGYYKTAEAFGNKGVKVFISWDGWIDKYENDNATAHLLDYLINDNNTVSQAVSKIPLYDSVVYGRCKLDYYPHTEAANYRIPDFKQKNIVNNIEFAAIAISKRVSDSG
jgi:hypothetical protein